MRVLIIEHDDSAWRGWQLGAASYVTKPFDNEELISELLRVTRPAMAPHTGDPASAGRNG